MTLQKTHDSSSVGEQDVENTPPLNDSLLDLWLESQDPLIDSPKISRKNSSKQKTEEDICCQLCYRGDDEKHLLLCDKCNDGYHMQCLKPPLMRVPKGKWYCWMCSTPVEILHPLSTPKPTQIIKNEPPQPLPKTNNVTRKREIIELVESDSEQHPQEGEWMSKKKLKQETKSPEKQKKNNNTTEQHVHTKKPKQKSKPKKTEEQKRLESKVLKRLSKISESLSELKGKYEELCTKDDFF